MTWSVRFFIIFLLLNFLLTVCYLIVAIHFRKIKRHLAYARAVVMLLVPGAGTLLMVLGWFGYEYVFRKDVDLSDVIFSKERGRELVRSNEEIERNVVSLEEAIAVTDKADLRSLVMGVAQGDYEDSLSAISLALNSEDTETAHYAASLLQDAINDFRLKVQKGYNKVQKRDEELEDTAKGLIKYMNKVLIQKVFTDLEQRSFTHILEDTAQILHEEHPEALTSELYEIVCLRLLEIKDFEKCELWANRAMAQFPNTLSSHTCLIKYFFNSGQKERFFEALDNLKKSSVVIDKETLELIRAFQ
ncbi:MAG: hypothetical protein K6A74_05390 [Lachnospiraceae bacterium]|nr:hypothetical protein [Lachnospiraceae bacterium]